MHDRYKETRCKASTKSGDKCKRRAVPGSEYCKIHQSYTEDDSHFQRERNTGSEIDEEPDPFSDIGLSRRKEVTKSGKQCKRRALPGSPYCKLRHPKAAEKDTQDIADILKDLRGR